MEEKKIVLGVDIGGSHITCAQIDLVNELIISGSKVSAPVNSSGSSKEILDVWINTIKVSFAADEKPNGIGVAMPGPFDYETGICLMKGVGKYDELFGVNIINIFSEASGLPPEKIKFLNDASCFALGEYYTGAGRGSERMIAITIGTGFGSSIIVNGEIVTSGEGVPDGGMFWNVPFKKGIADDYFSTRWFEDDYFLRTGSRPDGVYPIAEIYETDENAKKVFDEFTSNLIEFVLPWIEKFQPDVLVTGGSISKSHFLFVPSLQKELFKRGIRSEVRISELWEDAALIGSGNLIKN